MNIEINTDPRPFSVELMAELHATQYADVLTERVRQLNKFGWQNRTPQQWFMILAEEVGEVAKECVEIEFNDPAHPHANPERYRKELVEVAAVALAALLNFDQRQGRVELNISGIVCYLESLSLEQLQSLRYEHEGDEGMLILIDSEIEAKTVPRCMFCEAELTGKTSYCQSCNMSPGTYHYD